MASSAKKLKNNEISDAQLKLLYGEDEIAKYWDSSLFNTVYLRHDLSEKHSRWMDEADLDFQNFLNTLRNLAAEYKDREKELSNWSETETINNWVKHVLQGLGWTDNCSGVQNPFLEETSFRYDGKTYRTDILIVDHPKEKQYINQSKGDDKLVEARQSVLIPVEVKYWQRLEEYRQGKHEEKGRTDSESDDIARVATPNEQTIQYMDILAKNWGILTDGARWRLFNTELSKEDSERFYEFNLFSLFQSVNTEETEADSNEIVEAAKYFFHFFSKSAFFPKNEKETPFVDQILQYSRKYVNKVEEDLKGRFVKAMNIACNGFYQQAKQIGQDGQLSLIRNISESALFNILFIKSLESRGVLPMAATDYKKISLSSIIDKIERFDPEKDQMLSNRELERAFKKGNGNSFDYKADGTELHDRILRLTGVIQKGATKSDNFGFEISGFRESIFSNEEWKMFKSCKLSNDSWVKILFELGYAESESLNRKYQQIPYAYFTPRQLGSIYESFLEFKLDKASADMIFENKQWVAVDLKSKKYSSSELPKARKGEVFFTPDNIDRKDSGSYYTPDSIVQSIVFDTLYPLVVDKTPEQIKKIKVCDPAMGSGHFLGAVLKFLTKAYVNSCATKDERSVVSLSETKCEILHSSIYGVDINPRAVKLAKMSLWLESATIGTALENLDDQLKCGDALVSNLKGYEKNFDWQKEFIKTSFSAIVGNPPWISMLGKHKASSFEPKYVNHLVSEYNLDTNRPNIYEAFFRKSLALIEKNENARYGVIVPDRLGLNEQFQELRKHILEKFTLEKVVYGTPFPGVIVDTGIFIVGNKRESATTYEAVTYPDIKTEIEFNQVLTDKYLSFSASSATDDAAILRSEVSTQLVTGGLCSSFVGFIAGKDKLSDTAFPGSTKVLKGRDIQPFKCIGFHHIKLDRSSFIGGTQDLKKLTAKPKILIRKTGNRIIAALDLTGAAIEQSLYALYQFNGLNPKALTCFLNSNVATDYYMANLVTNKSSTPQLKKIHLDQFPIPVDLLKENESTLVKLYDEAKSMTEDKLNEKLDKIFERTAKRSRLKKAA